VINDKDTFALRALGQTVKFVSGQAEEFLLQTIFIRYRIDMQSRTSASRRHGFLTSSKVRDNIALQFT
jgi:hypothetical protein